MVRIENKNELLHENLSQIIIGCCFEVIKELGSGFLESVYKKALFIAMEQKGLNVSVEKSFEVVFRNHNVGKYIADIVVEDLIIVELKCCKGLLPEHQAQVVNYLKASGIPIGILVNFGNQKVECKRLRHPNSFLNN